MASFASSATTGVARKHAWTRKNEVSQKPPGPIEAETLISNFSKRTPLFTNIVVMATIYTIS